MINLEDVREKLYNLLNGKDTENIANLSPINDKYFFEVASEGYELKRTYDMKMGKNFFPVYIASSGGEINPIPELHDRSLSIQVSIYFPVREKDYFYTTVCDFLEKTFVGRILTYNGEKAVNNISVPTYGEMDTTEVEKFENFIEGVYMRPIKVSEQWMSMNFLLYLNQVGEDFVFGNEATATLSFTFDGVEYSENVIFDETTITISSSAASEQLLGENEVKNVSPTITTTNDIFFKILNIYNHSFILSNEIVNNCFY